MVNRNSYRAPGVYSIVFAEDKVLDLIKRKHAWIAQLNGETLPGIYEASHVSAFEKAKELINDNR